MQTKILKHLYINKNLLELLEKNRQKIEEYIEQDKELENLLICLTNKLHERFNYINEKSMEECMYLLNKLDIIKNEIERLEKYKTKQYFKHIIIVCSLIVIIFIGKIKMGI